MRRCLHISKTLGLLPAGENCWHGHCVGLLMQYRLTLWREEWNPSEGPLWEEVLSAVFPRFEQGDLITEIQSMAKMPDETFAVSRVEYGFKGIGVSREITQNVYIQVQVGGLSN